MSNIIVVFPKLEDAKNIKNLLVRHGYDVTAVCTLGAQALNYTDHMSEGVVVCGYRFADMLYSDLKEELPPGFEILLLASERVLANAGALGVIAVSMPLKVHDFLETMELIDHRIARKRKKRREKPKTRSQNDKAMIDKAKLLLMERNHLTEEEAHRYIQKHSMDSGNNMAEMAEMILSIMDL